MSKEAMKLALEKIANVNAMDYEYQAWAREALAEQPAQQEPVECANGCRGFVKHSPPAQRTWVGLTDEEIESIFNNWPTYHLDHEEFARVIEDILREKNL